MCITVAAGVHTEEEHGRLTRFNVDKKLNFIKKKSATNCAVSTFRI